MAKALLQLLFVFGAIVWSIDATNHGLTTRICRKANEVFSECGKNSCQNTCRRPNAALGCVATCIPGCVCAAGFVRTTRHTCVTPNQCGTETQVTQQQCGANEVFSACGNDGCRRTCTRLDVSTCVAVCNIPACVCAVGFVRNAAGACVLPGQCPAPAQVCGVNEVFSNCGNDGCQRTCTRLDVSACVTVCNVPACVCAVGFVRNAAGQCVLPGQCPATTPVCGANEVFSTCGNDGCQRTCTRLDVTGCVSSCLTPACVCAAGFVRNSVGQCVLPATCPVTTTCAGANEVFSNCGNTRCQVTCSFTAAQAAACTAPCNPGCVCANGFLRNFQGLCVAAAQCSVCPANELFRTCGAGVCEGTCATPNLPTSAGCSTVGACTSRCFCNTGVVRNTAGNCVAPGTC